MSIVKPVPVVKEKKAEDIIKEWRQQENPTYGSLKTIAEAVVQNRGSSISGSVATSPQNSIGAKSPAGGTTQTPKYIPITAGRAPTAGGEVMTPGKFFSLSGQIERLKNVGSVLNIAFNPFSKGKIQANVNNPTLKKALETAASHPYLVAGAATAAIKAAPIIAAGARKIIPAVTAGSSRLASPALRKAAGTALLIGGGVYGIKTLGDTFEKAGAKGILSGSGSTGDFSQEREITLPDPNDPGKSITYTVKGDNADFPSIQYVTDPATGKEIPMFLGSNSSYDPATGITSSGDQSTLLDQAKPFMWAGLILGGIYLLKKK